MTAEHIEKCRSILRTCGWVEGMLAVSLNDGTRFRIVGHGEEPMRIDWKLGQYLAEWPVQTGCNSLIPDLDDEATRAIITRRGLCP